MAETPDTTDTSDKRPTPTPKDLNDKRSPKPPIRAKAAAVAAVPTESKPARRHDGEHRVRSIKELHDDVIAPLKAQTDEIRTKLDNVIRELEGADKHAEELDGGPGIGIKQSLDNAHGKVDRLKSSVEERLDRIEAQASTGNPYLVRKAKGDADQLDGDLDEAFDTISKEIRALDTRVTKEVERLDGRVDAAETRIDMVEQGQSSTNERLVKVEKTGGGHVSLVAIIVEVVVAFFLAFIPAVAVSTVNYTQADQRNVTVGTNHGTVTGSLSNNPAHALVPFFTWLIFFMVILAILFAITSAIGARKQKEERTERTTETETAGEPPASGEQKQPGRIQRFWAWLQNDSTPQPAEETKPVTTVKTETVETKEPVKS